MADEREELIEYLLMTEDVPKAAKVGEQVETKQERSEDFASSSEWRMCPRCPRQIDVLSYP